MPEATSVENGDYCEVVAGTHKGKSGTVEDRKTSKTGAVTITVRLADDDRIKTLAKNVVVRPKRKMP
jgi:ribosomal protein S4E